MKAKKVTAGKGSGTKAAAPAKSKAKRKLPKWSKPPEELVELFGRIAATNPKAEQKKMFGCPVAFFNGNMFFSVHQSDLICRLAEDEREKLVKDGLAEPFCPMPGMTMKEYVSLGSKVVKDEKRVLHWFNRAFAYAESLPVKKKKAKKSAKSK